jgi:hypothetical protein
MADPRLVTVKAEQDVASLVRDVFVIPETGSRRVAQEAAQAIVEANPHLAGLKALPEGTPVIVPDMPELTPNATAAATPALPLSDLMRQAGDAIQSVRSALAQSTDSSVQEAKATLQLLGSKDFAAAAANDPSTAAIAASITAASNAAIKDAETKAKEHNQGLDDLTAALEEFANVTGFPAAGPATSAVTAAPIGARPTGQQQTRKPAARPAQAALPPGTSGGGV